MNRAPVRCFVLPFACALVLPLLHAQAGAARGKPMNFKISTSSFLVEGTIPKKFTCDAQDISPELSWSGASENTRSFALIADDPDAPAGTWTHWIAWNIPASAHELKEGVAKELQFSDGMRQGQNDFRKIGYNGPCPPPGKPHRYYFKLFALDANLDLKSGSTRKELESAMKSHLLAQTDVLGRYGR